MDMNTQEFMRRLEDVEAAEIRYDRAWFWVTCSIVWSWYAFWNMADNYADSPYTHVISWACIGIAFWFARNF